MLGTSNSLRCLFSICLLVGVAATAMAQPVENPADKTLLQVEILIPRISSNPLLPQRWRKVFEELGEGVRIRQPLSSDHPEVSETSRGPFRVVKVIGEINRKGDLVFPDKTFSINQGPLIQEWLNELRTYGAQGSPDGKPFWGLTEKRFQEIFEQLQQPVTGSLKGVPVKQALEQIPRPETLKLVFHSSAQGIRDRWQASDVVTDEVQGLSAGSALAYVLSQQGLGFRPLRTPSGEVELVVEPVSQVAEVWPVGWPFTENVPRNKIVPGLFKTVDTGIPSASLTAALDAIESRTNVRILVDFLTCQSKGIQPSEIQVTYPRKRTAWALIVSSVTVRSHLTMNYRQDEAGTGFLFITPFAHYVPKSIPKNPKASGIEHLESQR